MTDITTAVTPNELNARTNFHTVNRKPIMGAYTNSLTGKVELAFIGETFVEVLDGIDGTWRNATVVAPTTNVGMVQQGFDSFLIFGGYDKTATEKRSDNVCKYDENGLQITGDGILQSVKSHLMAAKIDTLPNDCLA